MTISSPTFQRLQDGIKSVDDLRVRGPINTALAWLSGGLVTQLNTHFGAVSNSVSAFLAARPTFMAHKNGVNQASISGTATPITFGTEDWDTGGHFSSSAYTPPAGKYRLTCQLNFTPTNAVDNESLQVTLEKNGSVHRLSAQNRPGTAGERVTLTTIVDANGTDVFTINAIKGGAGVGEINGTAAVTWFCGEAV